jgi:type IV secretion system protein TrbG
MTRDPRHPTRFAPLLVLVHLLVLALGHLAQPAAAATPPPPSDLGAPATAPVQAAADAAPAAHVAVPAAGSRPAAPPVPTGPAAPTPAVAPPPSGEALTRTYRHTGIAPVVGSGGSGAALLVPYGHARPELRCAPLRACAIELEAGELVLATSLGDAERWLIQAAAAGPGAATPLVVVKPTACDLSTNLVVSTDRRIYELALDSPPCHDADGGAGEGSYNPHLPYTGLVRFYYPDELVRRWEADEQLARQRLAAEQAGRTALAPESRLAHLNFDYAWDRGRRWPWVPAQVFDDGVHTYLVLPPAAQVAELPILLGVEPGGALALLTYRLDGRTLVADRVLEHAVLVVGHGSRRDEQRLDVVNRAFGRQAGREVGR